ncbi:MAG TPA: mechanosensitive ion channel family protein [Terriglobia bacterium]|nr:mechanosensitive ion channel family protein [Terriglobia bacterium]
MMRFRVSTGLLGIMVASAALLPCLAGPPATPEQQARSEDVAIIRHLNVAISWYKQLMSANESAGQPSEVFYLDNARSLAKEALQLAFQSAESEADLLLAQKGGEAAGAGEALPSQNSVEQQEIAKSATNTAALISQAQTQIDILNRQIAKAAGKKLQELTSKRDSLQEQLDFDKALEEALQKLSTFMSGSVSAMEGVQKEVNDLKKSVPDLFAKAPTKEAASAPSTSPRAASEGSGLISQVSTLFARLGDLREVDQLIDGATQVSEVAREVQAPLRTRIRATIQQGRDMANQPAPQDPAAMEASRRKMTSLTRQFKQISNATLPLTQEIFLLEESQTSLRHWEDSVHKGYVHVLKSFLIHLAFLIIGISVVLGFSELWRRATFRYVHEPRRRHQLLLVRRIVTGVLMAIVLALGLVSEFGSLATFAGFLTAGIAVALQTLILSVAAYFLLIGRHGVRVGDRITVANVTGDVIDVGPVRLYMMELGGAGADLHPTGRVVVVSNSVLFQGVPFFKQIPGAAYSWHEVAVKLERGSDYGLAESKLLEAVNSVYSQYRDSLEQQHQALEGLVAIPSAVPSPQTRLQLVENGLYLLVRYPVVLHRESEIDNQVARKVVEVIDGDPELKAAVGSPTIRPESRI